MTPLEFAFFLVFCSVFLFTAGLAIGRFNPSRRLLDDTYEEGFQVGYESRPEPTREDTGPTSIVTHSPDPSLCYDSQCLLTDLHGLPHFRELHTGMHYAEANHWQNRIRYWESIEQRTQSFAIELGLPVEEPLYVPDTWLHDQLEALYAWSEKHRATQARWFGRTLASTPLPPRPGSETRKEITS